MVGFKRQSSTTWGGADLLEEEKNEGSSQISQWQKSLSRQPSATQFDQPKKREAKL